MHLAQSNILLNRIRMHAVLLALIALACGVVSAPLAAQVVPGTNTAPTASSFQGSVASGEVSAQPIDLTLDDAMQRGLKTNLGIILSGAQTASARGQKLSQL